MSEKRPVFIYPSGTAESIAQLAALIGALDCAILIDRPDTARVIVVAIGPTVTVDAAMLDLIGGAADGKFRLIGVRTGDHPCPDALKVAARSIVSATPDALHAAICLDEPIWDVGGDGPPAGYPCGQKG